MSTVLARGFAAAALLLGCAAAMEATAGSAPADVAGTAPSSTAGAASAGAEPSADAPSATVPEPADYRMEDYKAPVPATLAGATVIDTAAAEALWRGKAAVFVDALPRPVKPANLPAGTVWHDKPRPSIPGAAWLANVGYGKLAPAMEDYFRTRLEALTGGRRDAPVVFFCLSNCWMSWNAAKRAISWGYGAVSWYPAGTDGWAAAGLPLENATPYP